MFGAFRTKRVPVGSALARTAMRLTACSETLETWAGGFLILVLGLLGAALPHFP
ncbi:hypothetical protein ACVIW2_004542 [Bradyrhizobium huanghuaihaiense]|jgi:hypothetical protein|uniref:Uncharacterized protein n=2 Tax=Bradyrhizobium TaxID=374 RepID=A0A809Z174_9BRAD|nr:hypothetical protein [Bradyrhizobium japonicum]TWI61437.1 hypothetical protein IQ16_07126 [Bradyrhizobium huanghuaihaiense]BCE45253.1 hypothetical protein XF4B_16020 [Bradyrhizobium diazoefficiens]MCP1759984.1 hypothetical protein [Bradyrhizobium japonicum]MCP1791576.1 hypothetical protein [Bradyrhizobium japonicum]